MGHLPKLKFASESWKSIKENLIISGLYEDGSLTPLSQKINDECNNIISNPLKSGNLNGSIGKHYSFYVNGKVIVLVGLGSKKDFDVNKSRVVAGNASRYSIKEKYDSFAIECFIPSELSRQSFGEGLVLGSYQFKGHKLNQENSVDIKSITVIGAVEKNIQKGFNIGKAICFSRDLGNHPANIVTPSKLEAEAREIAENENFSIEVFDREEFTEMGMGGLSGVAQGTDEPPKFIVVEYFNGKSDEKPKIIVGKGLTFDAGGISIKPANKMDEMKYDMCGSAVVLGVLKAISLLKPSINVVGIIPSTENLVGAKAYKPGDVLKAYNGKTIEVLNTDAEGRIILSDALSYASRHYKPEYIIDFATLTGAVLVALGHIATGILGTDDLLIQEVKKSSAATGEKVWELPLWPEFCDQVKSDIADVKNMGLPGQAGTIAGAAFLKEFVGKDIPWVHFDIAGTAWGVKPDSLNPKGSATGWGVRLVLDLMKV